MQKYINVPPIRNKANNNRLKEALQTGLLDFIAQIIPRRPGYQGEISSGNLKNAWEALPTCSFSAGILDGT